MGLLANVGSVAGRARGSLPAAERLKNSGRSQGLGALVAGLCAFRDSAREWRRRFNAGMSLSAAERRLLGQMPLHAVTSVHGEAGLRERLAIEIEGFPATERGEVDEALGLAARLHAGDRRQREPYVNHLLRVAIRIVSHYRVRDAGVACAALLHDAVEDHADELAASRGREAALGVLARRFGERVAVLVGAVTNPEYEPGRDEHEQYREHVAASLEACPWARVIKASDFTDNGVGLIHTTGPKIERLAAKYGPLVPVLRELILRADTPLDGDVKAMVAGQLDRAQGRFAAIWHAGGRDDAIFGGAAGGGEAGREAGGAAGRSAADGDGADGAAGGGS